MSEHYVAHLLAFANADAAQSAAPKLKRARYEIFDSWTNIGERHNPAFTSETVMVSVARPATAVDGNGQATTDIIGAGERFNTYFGAEVYSGSATFTACEIAHFRKFAPDAPVPDYKPNSLAEAHFQQSVAAAVNEIFRVLLVGEEHRMFWHHVAGYSFAAESFTAALRNGAARAFGLDEREQTQCLYLDAFCESVNELIAHDESSGAYYTKATLLGTEALPA